MPDWASRKIKFQVKFGASVGVVRRIPFLARYSVTSSKYLYTWEFLTAIKRAVFSESDNQVVCIMEQRMGDQYAIQSGKVALFNVKTGEEIDNNECAHSDVVTDLQLSKDRTYCITSSKDAGILFGGGQKAMNVTTTSGRQGEFETRFWHKVYEEEVGRVNGHFGPINIRCAELRYVSGGEDGFVRVHHFDESYCKARGD
ncbi:hypothetical protein C8J57DRAFT_1439697 [Mycena rebaudengoi]|nr:hypothetical protein C8J57DRAFT_1439697 [Mycena rebaudengoi]